MYNSGKSLHIEAFRDDRKPRIDRSFSREKSIFYSALRIQFLVSAETHDLGGGGTPLYRLYRYVRPQRVWFFGCVGHK